MQVSRFASNRTLRLLDLSLTPDYLIKLLEVNLIDELTTKTGEKVKVQPRGFDSQDYLSLYYLMCWPLFAACFMNVKIPSANFKPEYIIPQFLLQWVISHKEVDGIKYFSVKANLNSNTLLAKHYNYAIPGRQIATTGYCTHLTSLFSLTEPVSWSILTINQPDIVIHDQEKLEKTSITTLDIDHIGGILELVKGEKGAVFAYDLWQN